MYLQFLAQAFALLLCCLIGGHAGTDVARYVNLKKGNDKTGVGSTQQPYATLQKAIDVANDGDLIKVYRGIHGFPKGINIVNKRELRIEAVHDARITSLSGVIIAIKDADVAFSRLTITASTTNISNSKVTFTDTGSFSNRILVYGGELRMTNCTISANETLSVLQPGQKPDGSEPLGGAIYLAQGTATISTCIFKGMHAEQGGAVYVMNGEMQVSSTQFIENTASGNGGAIYIAGGEANIIKCIFRGNQANRGGALLVAKTFRGDLIDTEFLDNKAAYGGAVLLADRTAPTFYNCTFAHNEAHYDGGALFCASFSKASFKGCVLEGNNAETGGGIHIEFQATPSFTNSNFSFNTATNGGAVSMCDSSNPSFAACEITDNKATRGGALYLTDGARGSWWYGAIRRNHAIQDGGAFWLELDVKPKFNQTHFLWNECQFGVSFMKAPTTHPRFYHCSVWPMTEKLPAEHQGLYYLDGKDLPFRLDPYHDEMFNRLPVFGGPHFPSVTE